VVYSLTKMGREMGDIVEAMRHWGEKWALPYAAHSSRRQGNRSGNNRRLLAVKAAKP